MDTTLIQSYILIKHGIVMAERTVYTVYLSNTVPEPPPQELFFPKVDLNQGLRFPYHI